MFCITELYYDFYTSGVFGKNFIKPSIFNELSPITLAHLLLGDSTFNSISLLLYTDCFTIINVFTLINVLIIKYNINCTLRYHKSHLPRIYIYISACVGYV